MNDETPKFVTRTGRVLTDADIQALADEAERGYDVSHLIGKPSTTPWRLITHKRDPWWVKLRKRYARWRWKHALVCRLRGHAWYEKNSETDCCRRCPKCRRGQ